MPRELAMNPKKFGKVSNEKQKPWMALLHAFIEHIYLKRFSRDRPVDVRSIEEIWRVKEKKRERRKIRKQLKRGTEQSDQKPNPDA
jgi:hypothetical protein